MDEGARERVERLRSTYPPGTLLDEDQVPAYTLPDPLVMADGTPVIEARAWCEGRRAEVLGLFEREVYGRAPARPAAMHWEITSEDPLALGETATRREVRIYLTADENPHIDMLLYVPNLRRHGRAPVVVGLNYLGNQSVVADPGVRIYDGWVPDPARLGLGGVVDHRATEASRGVMPNSMPVEYLISRGYALATACVSDLARDAEDHGFQHGVHPAFFRPGQTRPGPDEWGGLAAWAWGTCRMLDYLVTDPDIDPRRAIVHGTSRLGKMALWAGATDERWALVLPNESGCGGAALSRRRFGETVARINTTFPYWFCDNFKRYNGNEDALPVDQHILIALIAPRPVYVASAEDDLWSDPRGEFLGALHAGPVYRLLGTDGLAQDGGAPATEMPAVHAPLHSTIAYHLRAGGHGINAWDWAQFLDYADARLRV